MAKLSGKAARVRYTGSATSSTGNASTLTQSTAAGGEFVQINSTARRHWNRNNSTAFKLYLNSTAVSSTAYDLNTVQGKFVFRSTGQSTGTYTADVEYLTPIYLTGARSWSLDVNNDMLDVTSMSTSATNTKWRTFIPGLSQATVSIGRFWSTGDTGPFAYDRYNLASDVLVELVMTGDIRFEGWGRIDSDSVDVNIDGTVDEDIDIQIDGALYYSSS